MCESIPAKWSSLNRRSSRPAAVSTTTGAAKSLRAVKARDVEIFPFVPQSSYPFW